MAVTVFSFQFVVDVRGISHRPSSLGPVILPVFEFMDQLFPYTDFRLVSFDISPCRWFIQWIVFGLSSKSFPTLTFSEMLLSMMCFRGTVVWSSSIVEFSMSRIPKWPQSALFRSCCTHSWIWRSFASLWSAIVMLVGVLKSVVLHLWSSGGVVKHGGSG